MNRYRPSNVPAHLYPYRMTTITQAAFDSH